MPNLESKFEALEAQLALQHTAIGNALDALLAALGVPPPTATVTLGDTVALMNAMNNNLIGIAIANGSFHTALLDELSTIAVNTDTIINNNSLNAQRTIAAILSTACACPTDAPFVGPPLDVTPTSLADEDKCRRIQYYLAIFGAMIDGIANYGGAGAMVTSAALTEILYASVVGGGLVGGEIGAAAGPPGIVVGAIVGIIGALIGSLGSSYLFTMSAQWHQSPLPEQLLSALYTAISADSGADAFYSTINASEVLNAPFKPLINALFWNGWANDMYSDSPVVDDSAFDGTICVAAIEVDCFSVVAEELTIGGYLRTVVLVSTAYVGWSVRVLSGGGGVSIYGDSTDPTLTISSGLHTLTAGDINSGQDAFWFSREFGGAYTLRFCPPGVVE